MGRNKAYMLMVLATLFFAGAFIAGKMSAATFSPVLMTFLRLGIALVVIFPIMRQQLKADWKLKASEVPIVIALGIIGMTFYHLFFFNALRYTSASNASVINGTMPIFTAILAFFILKERFSGRQVIFMMTAFLGVLLTITEWSLGRIINSQWNIGDLLMLCGTISWSTYGVLIKRFAKNIPTLKLITYAFMVCVIALTPMAVVEISQGALRVPLNQYGTILYMALFPTVMGYTIQQHGIKTLGPSTAALFINLVPIFSIILSVIILGEIIDYKVYFSGGIIIASVIFFTQSKSLQSK